MSLDFVKNKKLAICSAFLLCIMLSSTFAIGLANADPTSTSSNIPQGQLFLAQHQAQIDVLSANITQNINSIAATLSSRSEFTTQPTEPSLISVAGATYFSAEYGGAVFTQNELVNTSVYGFVWSENGTCLFEYTAVLDPNTFQILNVSLYPLVWNTPPNTTTPPTPPQMSDYTTYIIQGANVTPSLTNISSNDSSISTASSSSSQSENASPSYQISNWGGFEFFAPYPITMADADSLNVPSLQVPSSSPLICTLGISSWVGDSNQAGGYNANQQPCLFQGGWQSVEQEVLGLAIFNYQTFVEWYPNPEILPSLSVSPGSSEDVFVFYTPSSSQVYVLLYVGGTWYTGPSWTISSQDIPYTAQFIIETPTVNGAYTYLPSWSGQITQTLPYVYCNNGAWGEAGSWFIYQDRFQQDFLAPRGDLDAQNWYTIISPGSNEYAAWTYITSQ